MSELISHLQARCHPTCRTCKKQCLLLTQLDVNGLGAAELYCSGADIRIPFLCTGCDLCVVACNRRLRPADVFRRWRQELVLKSPPDFLVQSPHLMDRQDNLYAAYRRLHPGSLEFPESIPADMAFFPGCSLAAYTPELAWEAFDALRRNYPKITWLDDCCYAPLENLGYLSRYQEASSNLQARLKSLGVQTLVVACPTCYYSLAKLLPEISIVSIYDALAEAYRFSTPPGMAVAIHDACPDRFTQTLGRVTRSMLRGDVRGMKSEGKLSRCCGAGCDVAFFSPELGRAMVQQRLQEARTIGANTLVTYCSTCAVQLASCGEDLMINHVLDLILGCRDDYRQIAQQINSLIVDRKTVS